MVGVGKRKRDGLARVSIVDYHGKVLYNKYVKPKVPITDYRTRWSGIMPHHMKGAVSFKQARTETLKIIKDKIVVGHALHHDFKVLKINRNTCNVRDTSHCLQLRQLAGFPRNQTPSLRKLASAVLQRDIQVRTHCSIEDSSTAMLLYKAVRMEWEEGGKHGNEESNLGTSKSYLGDNFWPDWLNLGTS